MLEPGCFNVLTVQVESIIAEVLFFFVCYKLTPVRSLGLLFCSSSFVLICSYHWNSIFNIGVSFFFVDIFDFKLDVFRGRKGYVLNN